jgi:TRAP-type mannitol/chloroaromatic compound transport system substrate-binding protein
MLRRTFVSTATVGAAATAIAAPAIAQGTLRWTMVMPWPKGTPGVGINAERFAQRVQAMSGGRIEIRLYGAGELVPAFEVLEAVQSGTADLAHGTPYFFVGKAPALNYFTGGPFGLMAPELAAWMYFGDGLKLWRETYEPFGVIPFYAGSSGTQAGGWFRKEINTLADLQGLKFRIAGLGGDVLKRVGVVPVLTPPGEIAPALLSGAIDAAEWIGPWNDRAFGLYKVAKYYYTPAFHEPGPGLEVIVNKGIWDKLPPDLQAIIEAAASATANETYADFVWNNVQAFGPLVAENDVQVRTFSDEIVEALAKATRQSFAELAGHDEMTRKVHASFIAFLEKAVPYHGNFEGRMQQMREVFLATS